MSVKNIYVSSEDETLWEQASVLASRERRSTAWVVNQALRAYLRQRAIEDDEKARRAARRASQ